MVGDLIPLPALPSLRRFPLRRHIIVVGIAHRRAAVVYTNARICDHSTQARAAGAGAIAIGGDVGRKYPVRTATAGAVGGDNYIGRNASIGVAITPTVGRDF